MKNVLRVLLSFSLILFLPDFSLGNSTSKLIFSGPKTWNNWDGSESTNWNDPLNWSSGVPTSSTRARILGSATNFPVVTSAVNCLDLEIESGATLTLSNSAVVVSGNFTNNGTLSANTGTVTMFASGNATVSGTAIEVDRFVINKSSSSDSVFIQTDVSIIDEMLFINGIVSCDTSEVIFLDESSSRDGSTNSYINGTVRKIGDNDFTFPVGDDGVYAPIGIQSFGTNTEEYSAQYYHENPDSAGYDIGKFDNTLVNVSACEYWILNHDVGSGTARVTLSYEDVRSCDVVEPWNLHVARWNGNNWVDHGSSGYEGDTDEGTVKSLDAIANFSPFTLSSTSLANPLPVELLYFDAYERNSQVTLDWATATEINCDYYQVERSKDLINFETVGTIQGAGNSTNTLNYSLIDDSFISGTWYYRLVQFDFDGQSTEYQPKAVHIDQKNQLTIYPNPATEQVRIAHSGLGTLVQIKLFSSRGQVVKSIQTDQSNVQVPLQDLVPGLYTVELSGDGGTIRQKVIKK